MAFRDLLLVARNQLFRIGRVVSCGSSFFETLPPHYVGAMFSGDVDTLNQVFTVFLFTSGSNLSSFIAIDKQCLLTAYHCQLQWISHHMWHQQFVVSVLLTAGCPLSWAKNMV